MYMRVNTLVRVSDIGARRSVLEEQVLPRIAQLDGYHGLIVHADRSSSTGGVISFWQSHNSLTASDQVLSSLPREASLTLGGDVSVETFEQTIGEVDAAPT